MTSLVISEYVPNSVMRYRDTGDTGTVGFKTSSVFRGSAFMGDASAEREILESN